MSKEAMKLALEAFEAIPEEVEGWIPSKCTDAIIALKQALEQEKALQALHDENERLGLYKDAYEHPEPEPVAVVSGYYGGKCVVLPTDPARIFNSGTAFYTHPPKRKPLTDEEIILIVAECASSHQHTDIHFARAIERAHGIKGLV